MSARQRDLLLTAVLLGVLLTPAWVLPPVWSVAWQGIVLLFGLPALWYSWSHAPWQPTPADELERVLALLALGPQERFCDLGAGDGRLVLAVHQATGAHCTGIEASPLQWLVGRVRIAVAGSKQTQLVRGDLYQADLSAYDALYVWGTGYSVGTERFADLFRGGLRPGARLVSYHHPVPGLTVTRVDSSGQRPLHLYVADEQGQLLWAS